MKEPRSEDIHLSRRLGIDSNLFIGRSKTSLKELSNIFTFNTNKSLVRIGKRIDVFTESHNMKYKLCRGASDQNKNICRQYLKSDCRSLAEVRITGEIISIDL